MRMLMKMKMGRFQHEKGEKGGEYGGQSRGPLSEKRQGDEQDKADMIPKCEMYFKRLGYGILIKYRYDRMHGTAIPSACFSVPLPSMYVHYSVSFQGDLSILILFPSYSRFAYPSTYSTHSILRSHSCMYSSTNILKYLHQRLPTPNHPRIKPV